MVRKDNEGASTDTVIILAKRLSHLLHRQAFHGTLRTNTVGYKNHSVVIVTDEKNTLWMHSSERIHEAKLFCILINNPLTSCNSLLKEWSNGKIIFVIQYKYTVFNYNEINNVYWK